MKAKNSLRSNPDKIIVQKQIIELAGKGLLKYEEAKLCFKSGSMSKELLQLVRCRIEIKANPSIKCRFDQVNIKQEALKDFIQGFLSN